MVKAKKLACVLLISAILILCLCFGIQSITVNANEINSETETVIENEQASTRGWFASLVIGFEGGDGYVRPYVRNEFTLFPATIVVKLELYYADTYQGEDMTMTWATSVSTPDLNMGEKLSLSYPTGGVERYWRAKAIYRMDNRQQETLDTGIGRFNPNGEFVSYI